LATFLLIVGLASIGLPGTNGFVGEFLILLGAFQAHWLYGAIAVTGVIFGAAYFLWYYERAMLGPLTQAASQTIADLNPRELVIALSLSVMIFWIGLYPAPFLRMMNGSVQALVLRLERGSTVAGEAVNVKRETLNVDGTAASAPPSHGSRFTPHGT